MRHHGVAAAAHSDEFLVGDVGEVTVALGGIAARLWANFADVVAVRPIVVADNGKKSYGVGGVRRPSGVDATDVSRLGEWSLLLLDPHHSEHVTRDDYTAYWAAHPAPATAADARAVWASQHAGEFEVYEVRRGEDADTARRRERSLAVGAAWVPLDSFFQMSNVWQLLWPNGAPLP